MMNILAILVTAIVTIAAFVHTGKDNNITDLLRLACKWNVGKIGLNIKE